MCPWLLRKLPRPSLICTKFLGKKLQLNLDRFRFSKFYRFQFCRGSLAENFVTYFLAVISLQKFLGKKLSLQIFVGRSFSSKFGWTGITVLRFSVRISLQRFSGNDFYSNIFGTYFLFRVFV